MSLEELMNVKVSVASKKEESLNMAPGIVSVITREDIKSYGARNLLDLIGRLPGVYVIPTSDFRDTAISIRAQHSSSIDKNMLLLINGRPVHESSWGGYNTVLYRGFPIEAIERIEVIRGPGSVLYGTGAFEGVIDIKTKQGDQLKSSSLSYEYGSFNTHATELGAKLLQSEDSSLAAYFNSVSSGGWKFDGKDQYGAVDRGATHDSKDHVFYSQYNKGNFSLNGFYAESDEMGIGGEPTLPMDRKIARRAFVNAGYVIPVGDKSEFKLDLTHNSGRNDLAPAPALSFLFRDTLLEASFDTKIERFSLLAGAVYDDIIGTDQSEDSNYKSSHVVSEMRWKSFYTQMSYDFMSANRAVVGLQANDHNEDGNFDYSPRLGLILNFNKNFGLKLLRSQAFRAPSLFESFINIPGLQGNRNAKPQTITTNEAQFFYSDSWSKALLTMYDSRLENALIYVQDNAGNGTYGNRGTYKFRGVELEGDAQATRLLSLTSSFSVQQNYDDNGVEGTKQVPTTMAKLGASYQIIEKIRVGMFDKYYEKVSTQSTNDQNPDSKSYQHFSVNLTYDITPHLNFDFFADNLFEQGPVYVPDINTSAINTMPNQPGRSFYGKLKYQF